MKFYSLMASLFLTASLTASAVSVNCGDLSKANHETFLGNNEVTIELYKDVFLEANENLGDIYAHMRGSGAYHESIMIRPLETSASPRRIKKGTILQLDDSLTPSRISTQDRFIIVSLPLRSPHLDSIKLSLISNLGLPFKFRNPFELLEISPMIKVTCKAKR